MSQDLAWLPATEMAAGIAARRFSPVEVVEAVLARADAVDPALNAFAQRCDDEARAAARAAEAAVMAGARLGPLHGVPITVKDNVAEAGKRSPNGSKALLDFVPQQDAVIIQRLKAAGAILVARTNLPEFAHRILTDTPTFGVTRNPWNLAHTPGGSTGGGSAALAAGVGPLAIGTDGGGSIRCPASCVGAIGLKPTLGSVPFEPFPDAFGLYAFAGPLARHAADAALMFAAMAGPSDIDPWSIGRAPPGGTVAEEGAARGLRIGWVEHVGRYRTQPEVAALTSASLAVLAGEGAVVEPIAPDCLEDCFAYYKVLCTAGHATRQGAIVDQWGEAITPAFRESVEIGRGWSGVDLLRAQDRRTVLFRAVQALFRRFDVIATPTMLAPPPRVEAGGSICTDWYAEIAAPLYPFNMTGHPAISVPAGFAGGLPVGLQLVGPWLAEQRLLDLAALLERRQGFATQRPPI
jgi:aspartyl-tRNA(Asn)/glutamyl-tRNA(Gln) amidotransferase subunit A